MNFDDVTDVTNNCVVISIFIINELAELREGINGTVRKIQSERQGARVIMKTAVKLSGLLISIIICLCFEYVHFCHIPC
jgi:hypothetical protein